MGLATRSSLIATTLAIGAIAAPAASAGQGVQQSGISPWAGPLALQQSAAPASTVSPWAGPLALEHPNYGAVKSPPTVVRQAQSASPVVDPNADEQATTAPRYPGLVPGSTITGYPGLVPGSTTTRYPGLVPGSTTTTYPGLVPQTGQPTAHSGDHPGGASHPTAIRAVAGTTGGRFDWGDGAIGALVVLGAMAAGFGGTVLMRRRTNSLARTQS